MAKGIFLDQDLNAFLKQNTMSKEEFERRQAELAAQGVEPEEDGQPPRDSERQR